MKKEGLFRCHSIVKVNIPSVRYALAVILHEKHGFSQKEISAALGITQPAVSKYLSRDCSKNVIETGGRAAMTALAKSIAEKIARGSDDKAELKGLLDRLAMQLH